MKHKLLYLLIALLTFIFGLWLTPRYTRFRCVVHEPVQSGEFDSSKSLLEIVKGGESE
jgi:hypothetical protein